MKYDRIMIRFGELSTKGKNKRQFIKILERNIKHSLSDFKTLQYETLFDHIYIVLNDEDGEEIIHILKDISGIHSFSLVLKIDDDINSIVKNCSNLVSLETGETFKIKCKRSNKSYPIISENIIRIVAKEILSNTKLKVDVHNPDILISIEVRQEGTYIFTKTILGCGGYPLGSGGKVIHMLSGGIDSPVAAYLMLRRGIKIECIHFASPPYTNIGVIEKLKDILYKLNKYQPNIKLHIVPFTKLQDEIYKNCDESYAITIMRRMMYRLADLLAERRSCLAISNGESIGQVASQTLESISVINNVTCRPIIRPVGTLDKLNIINISKDINTYDISIRPFEDCCTIFSPKNPKTKPSLEKVVFFENKFDFQTLIEDALKNIETINISADDEVI